MALNRTSISMDVTNDEAVRPVNLNFLAGSEFCINFRGEVYYIVMKNRDG